MATIIVIAYIILPIFLILAPLRKEKKIEKTKQKPYLEKIINSLENNSSDWLQGGNWLVNKNLGISLWTSSGLDNLELKGHTDDFFTDVEKEQIGEAIKIGMGQGIKDEDEDEDEDEGRGKRKAAIRYYREAVREEVGEAVREQREAEREYAERGYAHS